MLRQQLFPRLNAQDAADKIGAAHLAPDHEHEAHDLRGVIDELRELIGQHIDVDADEFIEAVQDDVEHEEHQSRAGH